MEYITHHSLQRAVDEAVKLLAFGSSQYPKDSDLIREGVIENVIESISSFALNARRALEVLPGKKEFDLTQGYWSWSPNDDRETVRGLRDALNRIIHAQKLVVSHPDVPNKDAFCVADVIAKTDLKESASIDPYALAHAFLYSAYPLIIESPARVSQVAPAPGVG